jgi:hypothetical protein
MAKIDEFAAQDFIFFFFARYLITDHIKLHGQKIHIKIDHTIEVCITSKN